MARGIRKSALKEVVREVLQEEIIVMGEDSGHDMTEIEKAVGDGKDEKQGTWGKIKKHLFEPRKDAKIPQIGF